LLKFADVLRGYLSCDEERLKGIWAEAHFCLDTQVLLDVYRYTPENRAAFFKLLSSFKGRFFVPNRVAVEFARNRVTAIRGHFGPQRIIRGKLDLAIKEIRAKYPKHPLLSELEALVERAKKLVDDQYGEPERRHMSLIANDGILGELLSIIGDEVGDQYPEKEAHEEYKRRKEGNIPPFCKVDDSKDEERRKGDVVIWLELLKHYEGKKTPLIFVTDDMKENWWQESEGGRHDPQPALIREAYERTQADILFYTSERFSEIAPSRLGVAIPEGLAEETRDIRQQEREAQQQLKKPLPLSEEAIAVSTDWLRGNSLEAAALIAAQNAERLRQMSAIAARLQMSQFTSQDDAAWIALQDVLRRQRLYESAVAKKAMLASRQSPDQSPASAPPDSQSTIERRKSGTIVIHLRDCRHRLHGTAFEGSK
jgi:hypothetical protein